MPIGRKPGSTFGFASACQRRSEQIPVRSCIHGDPVAAKERIAAAAKNVSVDGKREDLGANPYGYARAFGYTPSDSDQKLIRDAFGGSPPRVLDSTAGGGSIPFSARLGCESIGNDLNAVAWLILKTTVDPCGFGDTLLKRYHQLAKVFVERASRQFQGIFPPEADGVTIDAIFWRVTVHCPYCNGLVPLSPNWKLNNKGVGCESSRRLITLKIAFASLR